MRGDAITRVVIWPSEMRLMRKVVVMVVVDEMEITAGDTANRPGAQVVSYEMLDNLSPHLAAYLTLEHHPHK